MRFRLNIEPHHLRTGVILRLFHSHRAVGMCSGLDLLAAVPEAVAVRHKPREVLL